MSWTCRKYGTRTMPYGEKETPDGLLLAFLDIPIDLIPYNVMADTPLSLRWDQDFINNPERYLKDA